MTGKLAARANTKVKGVFKFDKKTSKFREWEGPLPTAADLEDSDAVNSLLPGEKR